MSKEDIMETVLSGIADLRKHLDKLETAVKAERLMGGSTVSDEFAKQYRPYTQGGPLKNARVRMEDAVGDIFTELDTMSTYR